MTGLRLRLRAGRTLLAMCTRRDSKRALIGWMPFFPVAAGASYWSARELLSALPRRNYQSIVIAAVAFSLAFLASAILGRIGNTTRVKLVELTRLEYDERILEATLAIPDTERIETPSYLDRLELLRTRVQDVVHAPRQIGWLVDSGGGLLVSIALLVWIKPVLGLLILVGIPALIVNSRAQRQVEEARRSDAARSRRTLHLFDVATTAPPAKEIRVSGLERELLARYSDEWRASDAAMLKPELYGATARAVAGLAAVAAFGAAALVVLVDGVRAGWADVGDLFVALGVMTLIVGQVGGAAAGVSSFWRSVGIVENLVWLQDAANRARVEQRRRTGLVPKQLHRGIELTAVSHRYRTASRDALHGISLFLPAGTVIALVGDNGAGKSTLVKLLYGLYRPSAGKITIDGVDLEEMPIEEWRRRTSACFQDYVHMEFTAQESVGIGDLPEIDNRDKVAVALKRAAAADLLDQLPKGLDTQLGPTLGGTDLSTGQWQKVAIGRGMMRELPLLLALDEPTSALDPLAEHELFELYARTARELAAKAGTITVLVSHRFSTVRMADLIIVLDKGEIIEMGSHSELIRHAGHYAELYEMQVHHYR